MEGRQFLEFSVEDSGIGMSAETMRILFNPFTQAGMKRNRTFGTTSSPSRSNGPSWRRSSQGSHARCRNRGHFRANAFFLCPTHLSGIECRLVQTQDPSKIVGPLDVIIRAMAGSHGFDISRYEDAFLRTTISRRLAASGSTTLATYGEYLVNSASEAGRLLRSLRIDHSEFFRNPLTFTVIEQLVLPALVEKNKKSGGEIRVWSAGCAGGQEAWSLAILLGELAGPVPYRIFATDLSDPDVARAGVYSAEAVGNVRTRHLTRYFSRQGESFSIVPRLRERVDFSAYDLLDSSSASPAASIYGGFDIILCCNVLFYYRPEARQRILDKVSRALSPGGYFVTGEAEKAMVAGHREFRAVLQPAAVFQTTDVSP
jgi:chemotaxis methyl-accepting protein methylase